VPRHRFRSICAVPGRSLHRRGEILRSRHARLRQLQCSEAATLVRVHHELAAHGDADRVSTESHRTRHDDLEARDAAILLGHPGGQLGITPRIVEQHRWDSQTSAKAYFREMLFNNPWRDPELPSWVAEEDGRITGFQIVMPRPMRFGGHPIRVAVSCQFVVDPDKRRSLTALQLAQACMSGPQDLTLADGATDRARRI